MITRRQFIQHGSILVAAGGIALIRPLRAYGANIVAASPALSAVQAAVDAASDGDHVLIPNGSATWTSGIKTTKQIIIRAQNYTRTPAGTAGAGTMIRNVTITNNSGQPLFTFTSGNSFHCGIGGIRFNERVQSGVTTGVNNHIRMTGTGSKVPLIFDCAFQSGRGAGNQPDIGILALLSQGGVMWNCVISGQGFSDGAISPVGTINGCVYMTSPRAWTTPSTMGTLDTNGTINWYFEDSTFLVVNQAPDVDDHGRLVARRCVFDGSMGLTHGFTSMFGGRHVEYYNNSFLNTFSNRNHGNHFWYRAGTGVMTENSCSNQNQGYGAPDLFMIGDNTSPSGSYLIPRQPGCGHNGSSYVSDPIYAWNNTGPGEASWGYNNQPGGWQAVVQSGRDVFVNAGAKPGYAKFTYPHPLRAVVEGASGGLGAGGSSGGGSATAIQAPSNLRIVQ